MPTKELDVVAEPRPTRPLIERFTIGEMEGSSPHDQQVLSKEVEEMWLPYIGPDALLLARKIGRALGGGGHKAGVEVKKWSHELGFGIGLAGYVRLLHARDVLIRYGFATWSDKDPALAMLLRWPDVPRCIQTPLHREALMAIIETTYVETP